MPKLTGLYARSHHPLSIALRNVDRWGRVSHVGLLTPEGQVLEALWGPGVVKTPRSDFEARYTRVFAIDVECPHPHAALQWAHSQIGKPYDRLAIFGNLFRASWADEGAWQCAEYFEMALTIGGNQRFRELPWRISPNQSFMVK